jgi:hypothetical protein
MGDLRRWSDAARGTCGELWERGKYREKGEGRLWTVAGAAQKNSSLEANSSLVVQEICLLFNPKFITVVTRHASGRYFEPDESTAHSRVLFISDSFFNIILESTDMSSKTTPRFPTKIQYAHLICYINYMLMLLSSHINILRRLEF